MTKTGLRALAASITMAGALVAAPAFAQNFTDVNQNHWAYQAIQNVVQKYRIMEGFPDKTFRGGRTLTRYEFAAALSKVMNYFDERLAGRAPGGAPDSGDMAEVARMQKEFAEELRALQGRVDDVEGRLSSLEDMFKGKATVGGSVEARYRDRLAADEANLTGNADANTPNSPSRNAFNATDSNPFRVTTKLNVTASMSDWAAFHGTLRADEFAGGANAGAIAGGHRGYEGLLGSPVFVEKSFVALGSNPHMAMKKNMDKAGEGAETKDEGMTLLTVGLQNFKDQFNGGTKLMNHFNSELWTGYGYGLVGLGGDFATLTNGNKAPRYWGSGINASQLDPDSKMHNQVSAPAAGLTLGWGGVKFFAGANYGSTYTSRQASLVDLSGPAGATAVTGASFGSIVDDAVVGSAANATDTTVDNYLALPSQYGDGYALVGLDLDFGPVRVAAGLQDYWRDAAFTTFSGTRKDASLTLDFGGDTFGVTVQGNKSFSGQDIASLGLFANNLGDSGFGFGLGTKMAGKDLLFGNLAGLQAWNAGLYLVQDAGDFGRYLVAARQNIGTGLLTGGAANFNGAGLTAQVMWDNVADSGFGLGVEYNRHHAGALWEFNTGLSQDLAVYTSYKF